MNIRLITDRTLADVQRVKELNKKYKNGTITTAERAEYLSGMKGAYNASDFNRVGTVIEYIAQKLHDNGYGLGLDVKTDWTTSDVPTADNTAYYLDAVNTLREWFVVLSTTPDTPTSLSNLTYTTANDIEQILYDLNTLLDKSQSFIYYSSEIYSGEV